MYITSIPSRQNGKVYYAILLRESYREGGKVKSRTIANLTGARPEEIEAMRYALAHKNELVKLAAARVIDQGSRLSAVRLARTHAACDVLGIDAGFCEDDLYANLGWLAGHQGEIEKRLFEARRGGRKPELFLYDVTSSYLEGTENKLGDWGYNRDGKKGKLQIVIGMLCDEEGDPVSVEVFRGNTNDVKTFGSQIKKAAERFGCERVTLVGDRGMIKSGGVEDLRRAGFHYITAITKPQIETLLNKDVFQMELFDEEVCEVDSEEARYVLRRNPRRVEELGDSRRSKRASLEKMTAERNAYLVEHGRARVKTALSLVETKIKRLGIEAWLSVEAEGRTLRLRADEAALEEESRLDGCYVLKSDLPSQAAAAQTIHDRYKDLTLVEQVFRTCKTVHLEMRPVHVRTEEHTRGHALVVMLGYLIVRRLAKAWAAMDLTVQEGLRQLATLSAQTVRWPGQTVAVNQIPRPRETSRQLLEKAGVRLPEALPSRGVRVVTRRRLPERRKQV